MSFVLKVRECVYIEKLCNHVNANYALCNISVVLKQYNIAARTLISNQNVTCTFTY